MMVAFQNVGAAVKRKEHKNMMILNRYQHEKLGEIYCIGKDANTPICWCKKLKIKAFCYIEEEMDIYLNLYCFDINFERKGSGLVIKYTEGVEEGVIKSFIKMQEGIKELENEFIRFYNSSEFIEEYYAYFKEQSFVDELPTVNVIEDIYPYIEEKRICVYHDGFGIALKLKFMWMSIMIEKTKIFDENGGYVFTQSIENATKVSMNYN